MNPEKTRNLGQLIKNSAKFLDIPGSFQTLAEIRRNGLSQGLSLGWAGFDTYYQFPPAGQLSVITGHPSSGKSEWVDAVAVNMAVNHDWKIFVYSPENYPPDFHLQKLCQKIIGKPMFGDWQGRENITDEDMTYCRKFTYDHFEFIDCHIDNANADKILDSILLTCCNRDINMAIIDPWNKLESQKPRGQSTTDFIGECLVKIQMFARKHNIHFWIVAHPSKPAKLKNGNLAPVTLYDISDSSHWYNMTDNGFILYRSWDDKTSIENIVKIKIEKVKDNRYGKFGEHEFIFEPWSYRFAEPESERPESQEHNW